MNRVLALFLMVINVSFLFAQSNDDIATIEFNSFKEVLQYADDHAVNIKNAEISEQVVDARKKEGKSYLYPSVNASGGYNNNLTLQPTLVPAEIVNPTAPSGTFEELTFGQQHIYSVGIQVQWDILNFQKKFASETADIAIEQSRASKQLTRYNTYNALASTYYSILMTQESIQIYENNVRVSTSIFENTNEKYNKGIVSEIEYNASDIKQLENRKRLNLAVDNLSRLRIQLQSQLNTKVDIIVTDSPQNFIVSNVNLPSNHPEISWQETEVGKYQSLVKQKKSLLLPNISLGYQYNYNWATNGFMDFSNANVLPQQVLGLKLNVPIFNGFSSKQKITQAHLELEQQQIQLENTKLVKQNEDEILLLDVSQYARELADNKEILELMQKNDVHAENKYKGGITNLNERLNSYEDLLHAQNNYLQSLASYSLAKYKLYIRQIDFSQQIN